MPRKDNVDLICSIGELAGLFEKSTSLQTFLQTAVGVVAYHMRAAVCSVYLLDEDGGHLVLTATQGLHPDSIGRVRLKLGEGLVGMALQELRPIREGKAQSHSSFKFFPGIHEEQYNAFLAVPILRGLTKVGVLVVQDPVNDYFDENDAKALQAIAAQLASTVENAKLLMAVHRMEESEPAAVAGPARLGTLKGVATAPGVAHGRAHIYGAFSEAEAAGQCENRALTLDEFRRATAQSEKQIEALQIDMESRLADVATMIFSAHLLIVKDAQFTGRMEQLIREGERVQHAVVRVVGEYSRLFEQSRNPRLREKALDVKDLGRRILLNLRCVPSEESDYRGLVIVAPELLPSDILKLSAQRAAGLVLLSGGVASHLAILARAIGLPTVVVDDARLLGLSAEQTLLIDGSEGDVHVDPPKELVQQYENALALRGSAEAVAAAIPDAVVTADGQAVQVLANINMFSEMVIARQVNAGGVGLYRSEFPFIVRNSFPSEEEQFRTYRRIVREMAPAPVVFRTLDIGGDKILSYFETGSEANPFLGLRAIRFSLRYKEIFIQQLRALLRAGEGHALSIMFPLVSSVDDFLEAKEVVSSCIAQLAVEEQPHNGRPRLGVMIELPSAVEIAGELADEADFLSIGANDLVQYILAVDRTNEALADLYRTHHPAVLRALKRTSDAARSRGKPLSICGEMAADHTLLPFLVGIGIRAFSVEVRSLHRVYQRIARIDAAAAEKHANSLLSMARISQVEAALAEAAAT
jgi:phosphotransferase system, enzyme I, PtsP